MDPDFTLLSFSYFASDGEIDCIINTVEFIAGYEWQFLLVVCSLLSYYSLNQIISSIRTILPQVPDFIEVYMIKGNLQITTS